MRNSSVATDSSLDRPGTGRADVSAWAAAAARR